MSTTGPDKYCSSCGRGMDASANACSNCGTLVNGVRPTAAVPPQREWLVALLLSIFVGTLGVDRFYSGHIGLGILKLLTCGGCYIWWLIDVILIATNSYKDVQGRPLIKN